MTPIYYRTIRNLRCPPLPATEHVSDIEEEEEEEEELSEAERDRQIVESLRQFDIRAQGWSKALLRSEMSVVTPPQPRPSHVKTGQLPYIPPEIQSKILSHLVVQEGPILLRPKHSIDSKYLDGSSHDSPGRSGDSDDDSNKRPPTLVHTVPTMDLLLLNRLYHEECTRHFYSENSLMILGRTHLDDILQLLDDRKRAFVRHVTLEALVEIDSRLWISGSQRWMFMTVKGIWGHVGVSRLCLCPKEEAIFPNLQSITVRVRYRKRKRTGLVVPFVSSRSPEGSLTVQEYNNIWDRRGMEAVNEEQIAFYLAEMFECIGRGDWIPMYHLAFLPSEDRVWDDLAPTRPLSTFERVLNGSYKITAN